MATASHRRLDVEDASGPKKIINPEAPLVDEVPQGMDYKKLFAEEKFMNERVKIVLHPGQDLSEIGVPVGVNGKRVYLVPNQPQAIPRTHVAQLLKARPDYVMHNSDDYTAPEEKQNRFYKQSTSRYNFEVLEDTPKGIAWLRELRAHHTQK